MSIVRLLLKICSPSWKTPQKGVPTQNFQKFDRCTSSQSAGTSKLPNEFLTTLKDRLLNTDPAGTKATGAISSWLELSCRCYQKTGHTLWSHRKIWFIMLPPRSLFFFLSNSLFPTFCQPLPLPTSLIHPFMILQTLINSLKSSILHPFKFQIVLPTTTSFFLHFQILTHRKTKISNRKKN